MLESRTLDPVRPDWYQSGFKKLRNGEITTQFLKLSGRSIFRCNHYLIGCLIVGRVEFVKVGHWFHRVGLGLVGSQVFEIRITVSIS